MRRWIKLLVTLLLTVCLPLQGFAAVIMPACNSAPMAMSGLSMNTMSMDMAASVSDDSMQDCCKHTHHSNNCAEKKCVICHLSVFHFSPIELLLLADSTSTRYHDLTSDSYQIFLPPLFHPPKPVSA